MSDDRRSNFALPAAVAAVLCVGLYVGAYYALVGAQIAWGDDVDWLVAVPTYADRLPVGAGDRDKWSRRVALLFWPIHRVDRRIRRNLWAPLEGLVH